MVKYEAVLVSPEGDWLIDFEEDTIDKVKQDLNDMGSSWHFYPYAFIIIAPKKHSIGDMRISDDIHKKRIVDAPEGFGFMKGWTVERVIKMIVTGNAKQKEDDPPWGLW